MSSSLEVVFHFPEGDLNVHYFSGRLAEEIKIKANSTQLIQGFEELNSGIFGCLAALLQPIRAVNALHSDQLYPLAW